jgi:tetratricopeptide (TPR) repeat protein
MEARIHIAQGEGLFARDNFEAALAEYQRVYELLAGNPHRPDVLFNIAQCHERLFRYDAALDAYRRYLQEAPPSAEERATVNGTLRALDALLATIEVRVNTPRAEVWIDDRRAGEAPGRVRLPGGRHLVSVRTAGFLPSQQEVQLAARQSRVLTFAMEPIPQRRRLSTLFFWTSAGLAVASATLGTVFGLNSLSLRSDVDQRLADPTQRWQVSDADRSAIQRAQVTADAFFAGAALFGVGAVIFGVLADWRGPREAAPRRQAHLAPGWTPQGPTMRLEVSF